MGLALAKSPRSYSQAGVSTMKHDVARTVHVEQRGNRRRASDRLEATIPTLTKPNLTLVRAENLVQL
jgi:hypothetical protein